MSNGEVKEFNYYSNESGVCLTVRLFPEKPHVHNRPLLIDPGCVVMLDADEEAAYAMMIDIGHFVKLTEAQVKKYNDNKKEVLLSRPKRQKVSIKSISNDELDNILSKGAAAVKAFVDDTEDMTMLKPLLAREQNNKNRKTIVMYLRKKIGGLSSGIILRSTEEMLED